MKRYKFLIPIAVIIILGTAVYMFIYASNPFREIIDVASVGMKGAPINRPAPALEGISNWINISADHAPQISDLRGKVVLVDFWTYDCINCQHAVPYVVQLDKKYRGQGLQVVGIHTPEFRYEQKLENVKQAVKSYGIEYPVGLDNDYKTWGAYQNLYWPALYLVDKQGNIVYMHFGEGAYDITEQKIQELLKQ